MTQADRPAVPRDGRSTRKVFLIAAGIGALAALGHSPVSWPFVTLGAFLVAFKIFGGLTGTARSVWFGWSFAAGYFTVSLFWIIEPFMVDPEIHGWMAPFGLAAMAGGMALFWMAAFLAAARLGQSAAHRVALLVVLLGLAELARAFLLTGFPWAHPAYVWVETPLMQTASLFGPHGLGLLTLIAAALPVVMRKAWQGAVGSVLLISLLAWGGLWRLATPLPEPDETVTVRLVQPNAPQGEKWRGDRAQVFYERMLEFTAAASVKAPDIVIWPEASVTFWLDDWTPEQADIAAAAGPEARVVLGVRRYQDGRFYNSMALLDRTGRPEQVYDKARLVPFGEYIPFGSLLSRFGMHGLAAEEGGGFSAGPGGQLVSFARAGRALPLICYEAIFPHYLFRSERPDWLLQITNDAWFGEAAGPQQHFAQARFRAVEQGLPMVRVANTGISGVIDARGQVTGVIELDVAGFLDRPLPGALPTTLYARTGDFPVIVLLLLAFLVLVTARRRK